MKPAFSGNVRSVFSTVVLSAVMTAVVSNSASAIDGVVVLKNQSNAPVTISNSYAFGSISPNPDGRVVGSKGSISFSVKSGLNTLYVARMNAGPCYFNYGLTVNQYGQIMKTTEATPSNKCSISTTGGVTFTVNSQ